MLADIVPFDKRAQKPRWKVAEFFAGVGLARMGLENAGFSVAWANDIEVAKQQMYEQHFGSGEYSELTVDDIRNVRGDDLPEVQVAWSSFPCTDLSLAGKRAGMAGQHSSTYYEFTRVLREMDELRPQVVVLENVTALANSHAGEDIAAAIAELNTMNYSVDVITLDARRFVPQSRPRLFIIASSIPVLEEDELGSAADSALRPDWLQRVYGDPELKTHRAKLPEPPAPRTQGLEEVVERLDDEDVRWWDAERTKKFLESLSLVQKTRLQNLKSQKRTSYRTAYRRTRMGKPVWEIRADDIAGCLRTARGGSSKQAVVEVGHDEVRVRWMTSREYARLMGAGDYQFEGLRESQILFGFGDAVCVDAVTWLGEKYLAPLLRGELADTASESTEKRA